MAFPNPYSTNLPDIKSRLDCRHIAEAVLGRPTSRGTTWWLFRAPGREDKHPSFGVRADRYTDFATGETGDLFGLLRLLYNLSSFSEALTLALDLAGGMALPTPRRPRPLIAPQERSAPPPAAWQQVALAVVSQAEQYLWSDKPDAVAARKYLIQERGFTEENIRRFRLGFNPHWRKTNWRKPDGGSYTSLPPGITIPCFAEGHLWYVKVRCIVGNLAAALHRTPEQLGNRETPKYLNLAGGNPGALFNADALAEGKPALLVEGEFDAMLAAQLCGDQVAAVTVGSATNTLTAHFRQKLGSAPTILLCLDNDDAGQEGTTHLKSSLRGPVSTVRLPAGKDISEYVVAQQGNLPTFIAEALQTASRPTLSPTLNANLPIGLPDTVRAALNAYCYPAIAPTWELWTEAIQAKLLTPADRVTVKGLWEAGQRLGRHTSLDTIKEGLRAGAGQFWGILQTNRFQGREPESEVSPPICKTPQNTTRRGRRPTEYFLFSPQKQCENLLALAAPRILEKHFSATDATIAPVNAEFLATMGYAPEEAEQLSQALADTYHDLIAAQPELQPNLDQVRLTYKRLVRDLQKAHSTLLPKGWTYRNATEYAAVLVRALVEAFPNTQRSRKQLARAIGKSERSVDAVVARAGVENVPQAVERVITTVEEFDQVSQTYNPVVKGYPTQVVSKRGDSTAARSFTPTTREFVQQELAGGATVTIRYQQANRQIVATPGQPLPRKRATKGTSRGQEKESTQGKSTPTKPRYFGPGYDPAWVLTWAIKLMERTTVWRKRGDALGNLLTGELIPFSPRMVVGILLSPVADIPQEEREQLPSLIARDGLVAELLRLGGQVRGITPLGEDEQGPQKL